MKVKNSIVILMFVFSITLFSGCTNYYRDIQMLDVVLKEYQYEDAINITLFDLTPYPTLQEALNVFFTPNNTLTRVSLEIPAEERSLIISDGLMGHIIYYDEYFTVIFSTY